MDKLWNRNYIKVMIANFSLFFAFYLLTPLLPLYLHETFGATKDVIGLVLSRHSFSDRSADMWLTPFLARRC